MRLSFNFVNV